MEFNTFEDVLDFAILQEKAAQQFYAQMANRVADPDVQDFYRSLVEEEASHELKLQGLKRHEYSLYEPDMESLRNSGYLDAMPVDEDISLTEALQYAMKKERSARMLYKVLSEKVQPRELKTLFEELAEQESEHADYFAEKYAAATTG